MALGKTWAGKLFGTNTGNIFLQLDGSDDELAGILRVNDAEYGLYVYAVTGKVEANTLTLHGHPQVEAPDVDFGDLRATAQLNSRGELEGTWDTTIGSGGTFLLFCHDEARMPTTPAEVSEQLHTAHSEFGAVSIDLAEFVALAEDLQQEFREGKVIITTRIGSEISQVLEDFKREPQRPGTVDLVKIFVRERETPNIDRILSLEFGPHLNVAMTQGPNEAWVLGMMEKLKTRTKPFEQFYITKFKRHGVGFHQAAAFVAIAYLPSLPNFAQRSIFAAGVLALLWLVDRVNKSHLPNARIYSGSRKGRNLDRLITGSISWIAALSSALIAAILADFLSR